LYYYLLLSLVYYYNSSYSYYYLLTIIMHSNYIIMRLALVLLVTFTPLHNYRSLHPSLPALCSLNLNRMFMLSSYYILHTLSYYLLASYYYFMPRSFNTFMLMHLSLSYHYSIPQIPMLALMVLCSVRSLYLYHRLLHHNNTSHPYSHSFNNSFCDHMLTYTGFLYNTILSLSFNLVTMSYLFSYPMFILNSGSMPFNNYT